jgi:hypothetical protein
VKIKFVVDGDGVTIEDEHGKVWCGERHGFVHPESDYFQLSDDCVEERFATLSRAVCSAKWLPDIPVAALCRVMRP